MTWIKGKPTEDGWYWIFRNGKARYAEVHDDLEWITYYELECTIPFERAATMIKYYIPIEKPEAPE